jgi:hypothetical protein
MFASALTPRLVAAVENDVAGATDVVRQVLDELVALVGDQGRLRAAVSVVADRLPWCGPMWQVARATRAADPYTALRALRDRLDPDVQSSIATAVGLLTELGCRVRAAPGSALVDTVLAALPPSAHSRVMGLAGADAIGPGAVLNVAGTRELARAVPTVIVATSIKLVPQAAFPERGVPGFDVVPLELVDAVVLDGQVLTPAEAGRRAAALR